MSEFLEQIRQGRVLVSDGATGTYLQQHGLEAGGCPEVLNADAPEVVRGMAAAYFEAGSQMVETNSFGGSRYMLAKYGFEERVEELNRLGAELARSVAPPGRFVLGSIGPTGEFLEPNGTATETEMYDVFAEQARGLAAGGVDAFCVETMSDLAECTLAIRAAKEVSGLPVVATMTFDKGPRGFFTMMGITPSGAAEQLAAAGADLVGSNCGIAIEQMIEIIADMRAATGTPILTHINAGIPRIESGQIVYPDTPEMMAACIPRLLQAGANVVGGCCGTSAEHVRAFVEACRQAGYE
ncbi:MAG: homocysteine S-methyltransferase family protein [Planctomycetota bacterium]|nr:homocysteine S-methyltransferase family protein [Planctomycetota bacterium]